MKRAGFLLLFGLGVWPGSAAADELCGGRLLESEGEQVLVVSEESATCPWAFDVETISLGCQPPSALIAATEDGQLYGLNGTANSLNLADIGDIWRDNPDPNLAGQKVSIGPWMDAARSLCE